MEIVIFILIIIGVCTALHFYAKFLVSIVIKGAKKDIEKNVEDKRLLKLHKLSTSNQALIYIFFGGPIVYFQVKKAYIQRREIYEEELKKRNLVF